MNEGDDRNDQDLNQDDSKLSRSERLEQDLPKHLKHLSENLFITELARRKSLIQMCRRTSTDEHRVNATLVQCPGEGEVNLRMPRALRDGFELGKALVGRLVEIDLLMTGNDLEA